MRLIERIELVEHLKLTKWDHNHEYKISEKNDAILFPNKIIDQYSISKISK
jgi:hypothetical protein